MPTTHSLWSVFTFVHPCMGHIPFTVHPPSNGCYINVQHNNTYGHAFKGHLHTQTHVHEIFYFKKLNGVERLCSEHHETHWPVVDTNTRLMCV